MFLINQVVGGKKWKDFLLLHEAITSATLKHKYTDDKPNDSHDIQLDYEIMGEN